MKEAATLCGAAAAVTSEIAIGTGATNHYTRHPLVTAAFASTMSRLSSGRFALGLARGIGVRNAMMGLRNATNAELEDFVGLMRRLWRGERIVGHAGPAGESLSKIPIWESGGLLTSALRRARSSEKAKGLVR